MVKYSKEYKIEYLRIIPKICFLIKKNGSKKVANYKDIIENFLKSVYKVVH